MIHAADDGTFVISSHQCWMPGVYESKQAARYAFQFSDSALRKLQNDSEEGVITMDDLKRAKKSEKVA